MVSLAAVQTDAGESALYVAAGALRVIRLLSLTTLRYRLDPVTFRVTANSIFNQLFPLGS